MSDGVKLASGYVELTVKKAGNAMKEITAEITGVAKQAEKTGQQAGDAIAKGVSKGATQAGKTISDAISTGAEKAGKDAGKKAGDALEKGVTDGAKKAGKSVGDELDKSIGESAKRTGKKAGDSIGGLIVDSVRQGAKDAGIDLDKELTKAAGRAGAAIGNAIGDSPVGTWLRDMTDHIAPAVDGIRSIGDAITGIKNKDAAGTINGVADALQSIGQTGAASTVQDIATRAGAAQQNFSALRDAISGGASVLQTFAGNADGARGKLGSLAEAATAAAGPIGLAIAGMSEIQRLSKEGNEKYFGGQRVLPQDGIVGTPWWFLNRADAAMNGKGLSAFNPFDSSPDTPGHGLPGGAPTAPPPPAPRPAPVTAPATDYSWLPKRAKGGVTPAGMIFGPGTGTSDSIIGIGADGVPTARVSTGEGVVKKSAMDRGGAAIVAALNGGMRLPGYDDGTNNVGGAPIPMPQIKVPEATGGKAGTFNQWLSAQQGKAYQYGTLYDCSGFMSQIYNQLTGKQMPRFNTESDLAAYGFVRGSKPGTFQLGIHHGGGGPNSHMAGTLPDGRAVESGGNGVQIGKGAHGAFDPQFEDHWFLPGSEAMGGAQGGAQDRMAALLGMGDMSADPASPGAAGQPGGAAGRTQGYIPAGAGGGGQAGTSLWSGAMQMGASAVNGLIEQAASAASTAISAAATAGSFGAGGQAGGAASQFLIGIGTKMAERGVQYGFQMAGIGGDALAEIMLPFGVPRFFQTDPSQFMPQLPGQAAAVTTGEKAQDAQAGVQAPSPGGPVQPGQLPGQQPVGPSVPIATEGTGNFTPAPTPIQGLGGPQAQGPSVPTPTPGAPVQGPQPVQPKPSQTPPPGTQPLQPTDLAGLLGLAHGGVVGVYDNGGILPSGGIAINKSKRPEPILSSEQWGDVHALASHAVAPPDPTVGGFAPNYSVNIDSVTVKDVNELQREIDSRQRLQMMRHAGRP
ncbi:hypothetical protein [Mycobacterium colombiense]|uniref:Uncharacterized protein n=1 Tax=Mycobacterium colombiense TaxID=339268 RepID=A0A1A2ZCZ5_9MYCO|nr:hypothetical protein [Mycobacterium colombiense]OBI46976.1 hypothetical protein A5708_12065 [Mycobacterium colombiense]